MTGPGSSVVAATSCCLRRVGTVPNPQSQVGGRAL
jgi:hypothetical protein